MEKDPLQGAIRGGLYGAASGALIGGLSQGIRNLDAGNDFWSGSSVQAHETGAAITPSKESIARGNGYNNNSISDYESLITEERYFETFGVKEGDLGIDDITTKVPKKWGLTENGLYVNKGGKLVNGLTTRYTNGGTKISISPAGAREK